MEEFILSTKILNFWNQRAASKKLPGSNDKYFYEYEKKFLTSIIKKKKTILDVGCGDGHLLEYITKKKLTKKTVGIDFSSKMIEKAKKRKIKNSEFYCIDMKNIHYLKKKTNLKFDYIVTLRSLINIKNKNKQRSILDSFYEFLKPNGKVLCCEPSIIANNKINYLRENLGLKKISAPWHNLFIDDNHFTNTKKMRFNKIYNFTGSYYFFSRVINAFIKKEKNKEPRNNDKLNLMAMKINQNLFEEYSREKIYEFKNK